MASSVGGLSLPSLVLSHFGSAPSNAVVYFSGPLRDVSMKAGRVRLRNTAVSSIGARSGSSVLERPSFDQSQFDPSPQVMEGGDMGRMRDRRIYGGGNSFRVLLIDDACHTEKLVVNALPQIVPSVTTDLARKLFYESRKDGASVVIVAIKEHAEFYAQRMLCRGLSSAIEPDSDLA